MENKGKTNEKEKEIKKPKLFNRKIRKAQLLGEGSYGNVYKVDFEDNPGEYYALKNLIFVIDEMDLMFQH